jgi:broad specificity phosphatase PhoE
MADCTATRYFIRHAEVLDSGGDDPELSETGNARARALIEMLRHAAIGAIIVTRAKRSRQTAAPLADALQIEPKIIDVNPSQTEANVEAVLAKIVGLPETMPTLVIGHSNTLPGITSGLGAPLIPNIEHNEFDHLFVQAGGGLARLRFHP